MALRMCAAFVVAPALLGCPLTLDDYAAGGAGVSSASSAASGTGQSASSGTGGSASSAGGGGAAGAGFPATGVLDDFNRDDGPIGSNWVAKYDGRYSIGKDRLAVTDRYPDSILWSTEFGPTQEVFVTLSHSTPTDYTFDLLLKAQTFDCAAAIVGYDMSMPKLRTYRCTGADWEDLDAFDALLTDGDTLGARLDPAGKLQIYINGEPKFSTSIGTWPGSEQGGRIGLRVWDVSLEVSFDDFGGGTVP